VEKVYSVYILTNKRDTVLYTGITGDLRSRGYQHREKLLSGFTSRYNVSKCSNLNRLGCITGRTVS